MAVCLWGHCRCPTENEMGMSWLDASQKSRIRCLCLRSSGFCVTVCRVLLVGWGMALEGMFLTAHLWYLVGSGELFVWPKMSGKQNLNDSSDIQWSGAVNIQQERVMNP